MANGQYRNCRRSSHNHLAHNSPRWFVAPRFARAAAVEASVHASFAFITSTLHAGVFSGFKPMKTILLKLDFNCGLSRRSSHVQRLERRPRVSSSPANELAHRSQSLRGEVHCRFRTWN
jgi:hypothetical protein